MNKILNIIKRRVNMFLSLFQTASGSWHIQSILIASGWFITGILLFVQLAANRNERINSSVKEEQYRAELKDAREQIAGFEIRPLSFRLKELLNEIDPQILPGIKQGKTYIKIQASQSQFTRLQNLYAEKEAAAYITIDPMEEKAVVVSDSSISASYGVTMRLNPKLLKPDTLKSAK